MFPRVKGIVAMDSDNNIAYGKMPIGHAFDKQSRDLDFSVINRYISSFCEGDVVVVGESTFQQTSRLLEKSPVEYQVVTSSQKGIHVLNENLYFNNDDDDTLAKLQQVAFQVAMNNSSANIHVFGGVSVYKAFERVYDEFIVCRFHGFVDGAHKRLEFSSKFKPFHRIVHVDTQTYSAYTCHVKQ